MLLKNEGNLLPLKKQGKIALIGPLADTRNNIAGTWSVAQTPEKYTTIKEAMEKALDGKATLLYAQGSNIWRDRELQKNGEQGKSIAWGDEVKMKNEALQIAKEADVIICAMGETADMCSRNFWQNSQRRENLSYCSTLPVALRFCHGRKNTFLPS